MGMLSVLASCQKEGYKSGSSRGVISPRVTSSLLQTKGGAVETDEQSGTIALDSLSGLSMIEYVGDNLSSPFTGSDAATKGTVITTGNISSVYGEFGMEAFLDNYDEIDCDDAVKPVLTGTDQYISGGVVAYNEGDWALTDTYYWLKEIKFTFWSYAPVESKNLLSFGSAGSRGTMTITDYVNPSKAADQKDLLVAYNNRTYGKSDCSETVDIEFRHALSVVYFDASGVTDVTVKKISIIDAFSEGSCAINGADLADSDVSKAFTWIPGSTKGTFEMTGTEDKFFMIPQTLPEGAAIGLTLEKDGVQTYVEKPISTTWLAGKYYKYVLTNTDPEYVFEVNEESHTFYVTTAQQTATIDVTSAIVVGDEPKGNVEWTIKSVMVGSEQAQSINDASFSSIGGLSAEITTDGDLKLTAHERTNPNVGGHEYWTGGHGLWSPADWTSATAGSPIDLSKFNFKDETAGNPMITANCYIIRHAGTYKIPLVYGNGVVGGTENVQSYYPNVNGDINDGDTRTTGEGGNYRLVHFQNHLGNDIGSAFIENNVDCKAADCCIVWQDEAFVIKDLEIVGSEAGTYTKDNVRYLQFTVDNSTVCQNNAVIAVTDEAGNIIWSWLIWTTNDPALLNEPYKLSKTQGDFYFFPMYGIGWMDATKYPARADVVITIEQPEGGKTIDITVEQPEVSEPAHGNYYQFGRKDPMCRMDSPVSEGFIMGGVGKVNLHTAIMYPGTFYSDGDISGDWCSSTYDNLWTGKLSTRYADIQGHESILAELPAYTKTVYDPSPSGYQMPIYHALAADATVFPAKGLRHRSDGTKKYVTTVYYWSSFPNDNKTARYGYGKNTDLTQRAHAMSVRPVRE